MKKVFSLITFLISCGVSHADSPLTATEFYKAYSEDPTIQLALNSRGKITPTLMQYLANDTNPLDIKLAIINALDWSNNGTKKSDAYMKYILKKKKLRNRQNRPSIIFEWNASADELICFAYLRAMENYFDVIYASKISCIAENKKLDSYAVAIISGLIRAQGLFLLNEYCYAVNNVKAINIKPNLKIDLKNEGIKIINQYFYSLGNDCQSIKNSKN
jgi:hypothetical protein